MNDIETVGSSTETAWMPSGAAASAIVSPMLSPSMPETQTMSPASASSTSMRSSPANVKSLVRRKPVSTRPVARDFSDRRVDARTAAKDAADADASDVAIVVDRRDEHLERALFGRGLGDAFRDRFEERLEVVALVFEVPFGDAGLAVRVNDRRSRLARRLRPSSMKRSKTSFTTSVGARVFAIDLVDHDDRAQIEFERLAQHEARLRHDAFGGVDQQKHALHHLQARARPRRRNRRVRACRRC